MDLVQTYCVTRGKKGNYTLEFNTSEPASVTYSTERDGTNVITVNTHKKGETAFSNNYTSKDGQFKYVFVQPGGGTMKREPGGATFP